MRNVLRRVGPPWLAVRTAPRGGGSTSDKGPPRATRKLVRAYRFESLTLDALESV
jgi:hypothetical protein